MVSRAILNGWPLVPPCKAVSAPVFTVQPSISGSFTTGATLTANSGTIIGFPTPTVSYQWLKNGGAIPGATGASYVIQSSDQGSRIDLDVTASNVAGSTRVTIAGSVVTISLVPVLVAAPTISGSASVGSIISGDDGVWTNNPTDYYRNVDTSATASGPWTARGVYTKDFTLQPTWETLYVRQRSLAVNDYGPALSPVGGAASNVLGPVAAAAGTAARAIIPYDSSRSANAGTLTANRPITIDLQYMTVGWALTVENLPDGLSYTPGGTQITGVPTKTEGVTQTTFRQTKSGQSDFTSTWVFMHDVADWSPLQTSTFTGGINSDGGTLSWANQTGLTSKALRRSLSPAGTDVFSAALFNDNVGWSGDATNSGKYRSEIEQGSATRFRVGERVYFAFRSLFEGMVPPDILSGNQYQIVGQCHHVPAPGDAFIAPPLVFTRVKDPSNGNAVTMRVITRSTMTQHPSNSDLVEVTRIQTIPMPNDQWHDWNGYYTMGPDGTGELYLNVNGVNYLNLTNIPLGYYEPDRTTEQVYYWKMGLYVAPRPIATLSAVHKFEPILGKTAIPALAGRARNPFSGGTGSLLIDTTSTTGWTATNAAPLTADAKGLRIEGNGVEGQNPEVIKSIGTMDPTTLGVIAFPITIEESPFAVTSELQLATGGKNYSSPGYANQKSLTANANDIPEGTYWQVMSVADLTRYENDGALGTFVNGSMPTGSSSVSARIKNNQVTTAASYGSSVKASNVPHDSRIKYGKVYAQVAMPKVPIVITFDDSEDTIATEAQVRMDAIGAKLTAYLVPRSAVHKGTTFNYTTNKLSLAQLSGLKSAGHALACGSPGDISDTNMIYNTTVQDVIDSHNVVKAWITSNDLRTQTAGAGLYDDDHRCYSGTNPSANHDLLGFTGAPLTTTGLNITSGSAAFTLDAAVSGLAAGRRVRSLGVPGGTTILTLAGDGLSGTFSANATATGKVQAAFEDYAGQAFFRGKIQAGLRRAGVKTARATPVGLTSPTHFAGFGFGSQDMLLHGKGWGPSSTQAQVTNWINENIKYRTTMLTYIHRLLASPTGVNMSTDLFQFMLDGLNSKVQAGQAEFLTIGQYYEKYKNAQPPV